VVFYIFQGKIAQPLEILPEELLKAFPVKAVAVVMLFNFQCKMVLPGLNPMAR